MLGYGNPGENYKNTRHNVGFMVIDKLSEKLDIRVNKNKFKGTVGEGKIGGKSVILLKPETYMNLSGDSVMEITNFYKVQFEDILIVYDDIDIEFGKIRIKPEGSSGTHNGMRSVSDMLNTHDFPRVRIGIGHPPIKMSLADYVLMPFGQDDLDELNKVIDMAAEAVIEIINNGVEKAMNLYN